jgi:hypothetical protein
MPLASLCHCKHDCHRIYFVTIPLNFPDQNDQASDPPNASLDVSKSPKNHFFNDWEQPSLIEFTDCHMSENPPLPLTLTVTLGSPFFYSAVAQDSMAGQSA